MKLLEAPLLTPEEEKTALALLKEGETPIWQYWPEFVERYMRFGKSICTVQGVRDTLKVAIKHMNLVSLEAFFDIRNLDDSFHAYKTKRKEEGVNLKATTMNSYRKNINTLFIWLKKYGYIDKNPIMDLTKHAEEKGPKHIHTEEEISRIIYQLSTRRSHSLERTRNLFLIDILRFTGARPIEIVNIKLSDITPLEGSYKLALRGAKQKGKIRPYRFKGYIKDSYERYMTLRMKQRTDEPWLLISRRHGKKFGLKGMRYLFRKLKGELGFRITAYGFRRFMATDLKKKGAEIPEIGNRMGHTRDATTKSYIDDLCEFNDKTSDLLLQKNKPLEIKTEVIHVQQFEHKPIPQEVCNTQK